MFTRARTHWHRFPAFRKRFRDEILAILTFAGAESFAGDANWRVVDAIVVFQSAWRTVRAIIASAKERRLHHRTFLTSGTKGGSTRARVVKWNCSPRNALIARVHFPSIFPSFSISITLFPPHKVDDIKIPRTYAPYEQILTFLDLSVSPLLTIFPRFDKLSFGSRLANAVFSCFAFVVVDTTAISDSLLIFHFW